MTKEDMIRLAHEAGGYTTERYPDEWRLDVDDIERFANLVAAAEREACIKHLEDFSKTTMVAVRDTWVMGLIAGANALRARGRDE
jgi:hypothetical protein